MPQLFRIGMDHFYEEMLVYPPRRTSIQEQSQAVERRNMYILAHRVIYARMNPIHWIGQAVGVSAKEQKNSGLGLIYLYID